MTTHSFLPLPSFLPPPHKVAQGVTDQRGAAAPLPTSATIGGWRNVAETGASRREGRQPLEFKCSLASWPGFFQMASGFPALGNWSLPLPSSRGRLERSV